LPNSESYEYSILKYIESATKGSFILFLGEFTYNLTLALGSIVIARVLASEGYGAFSLALVPPLIVASLLSLGIDTAASRYSQMFLMRNSEKGVRAVIKASLLVKTVTGLMGSALCLIFAEPLARFFINRPDLAPYVRVAAVIVLLQNIYNLLLSIFIGLERVTGTTFAKITYSVVKTVASIYMLLLLQLSVLGALLGNIIGYTFALVAAFLFLMQALRGSGKNDNNSVVGIATIAKDMLRYSLPLYVASLIPIIVSGAYQNALLAYNLPDREIGGYRAMANLGVLVSVVTAPISATLLPLFTKFHSNSNELDKVARITNKYIAFVTTPVTVAAMIFSREIMYLFYGADYLFTYPLLPLLLAPNLLASLGSLTIPTILNAIGDTKANMYSTIISTAVFVPASYVLTISAKLWGFLIASLLSSIVGLIFLSIYIKKYIAKPVDYIHACKTYFASALSPILTLLVFLIPVPRLVSVVRIVLGFIIFLTTYIPIALVLGVVSEDDVNFIVKAFERFPIVNVVIALLGGYAKAIVKLISRGAK